MSLRLLDWMGRTHRSAFYLLLFMLPVSKAAIEIVFPILLVTWVVGLCRPGGWRASVWSRTSLRVVLAAVVVYLAICVISMMTSSYPLLSARGFVRKTLEYLLFFLIAGDLGREAHVVERGLLVVLASASLVGLDAVAQEVLGHDLLLGHGMESYFRMTGPYENPNDLAIYLLVVIPIVLSFMIQPARVPRWATAALLALLVGCLIRTMYVIGVAALLVGVLVFGYLHRALRRILLLASVVFVLAAVGAQLARGVRLSYLFALRDAQEAATGLQDRLWMWGAAWKMIQAHPWVGVGLNTFMANYLTYWVGGDRMPRYAHNCYLQVAAETGLVGLAAFLWLLWSMVSRWYRAIQRSDPQAPARMRLVGVSVGLIVFLAQSAIDTNFYGLRHAALFWTLAGLSTGLAAAMLEQAPRAVATEQPLLQQTRASRSPAAAREAR